MELKNNLYTESGWEIIEKTFDPDQLVTTGSNFMIGNGYLGYRGTFTEWEADRYVACIVTDTYDKSEEGRWAELCNVPNGLYTKLVLDDEELSIFNGKTHAYRRMLNLRYGLSTREQTWGNSQQKQVTLRVEKFSSYDNLHIIALRYNFQVPQDAEITILTGIDGHVWNLEGEHFRAYDILQEDELIAIETITGEKGIQIDVVEGVNIVGKTPINVELLKEEKRILRELTFELKRGEEVTFEKIVAIYSSNDVTSPRETAMSDADAALRSGYQTLKKTHQKKWDTIWETGDITIEGDLEAQTITRFNLYHNTITTPTHAKLPLGARGLSCQVYQGAAFWDQETFNFPVFLYTRPEVARNLLEYRYVTLDGARQKAKNLGYYGAFYAWASGKTGEELFPDYFFTDVLTGRKVRNHFNCWQIHISPDIVYAVWQYYEATGDWEFILNYGAEIAFEVAQFLVSHVYFKKDKNRYEFIRLLGPDEYHENVDNNAFTNYQAQFALDKAVTIFQKLQEDAPEKLDALFTQLELSEQDVENWQDIVELIYLPQPDPESLVIEQCDGFFDLEDIRPEDLKKRLIDPNEYWGWPNGIAVGAQVLKQADLLQLFALHNIFPKDVQRANYEYYEPHTEHGSSLSPSVHSIIASRVGYADQAYEYFMTASTIDLYNASKKVVSGGSFLGGIHTAACGGVWQMIVKGFAGFELKDGEVTFQPALPKTWKKLEFTLIIRSNVLDIQMTADRLILRSADDNTESINVRVDDQGSVLSPGEKREFLYTK